jgi:hypothetical protein
VQRAAPFGSSWQLMAYLLGTPEGETLSPVVEGLHHIHQVNLKIMKPLLLAHDVRSGTRRNWTQDEGVASVTSGVTMSLGMWISGHTSCKRFGISSSCVCVRLWVLGDLLLVSETE